MFTKVSAILLIVGILFVIGCAAHIHKVGNGAQGNETMEARQWYVLWGLVPINNVDTNMMAGQPTDYEITTQITVLDFIINVFTSAVTVYSRTVTVQK
ncbi:hypothetical protein C6501_12090 [Candidatus Poribacteria bacterium]|nr:MAG: hypothetical protein C6501_12090 [Candidatus Poribacteria bacterium]